MSDILNTLPIDCKFLILDLEGEAKMILCKFLRLIPTEKVPKEAIIIADFFPKCKFDNTLQSIF